LFVNFPKCANFPLTNLTPKIKMCTPRRCTQELSMRRATALSLFLVLLLSSCALAQSPSQTKRDSNDSGYTSPYLPLAKANRVTGGRGSEKELDNPKARQEALRENRGGNPRFKLHVLREAARERAQFGHMLPGRANAAAGDAPRWFNIGPTRNDYIQNGVTLHVTDSGRMRTILVHPENPNIVYLLTSSGGLWKTENFTSRHPHWEPKTDSTFTTSGGAASFGRTPETIYVGLGDPFENGLAAGGFMIKTTDGGETFSSAIPLPNVAAIRDVKVDTSGPNDTVLVATDFGLYTSTDSGATYTRAPDAVFLDSTPFGLFSNTVWSMARTSAGWLASTENPFVGAPSDGEGAIAISKDHGLTWQPIPNNGNVFSGAGRATLGVGRPGDKIVYAFAANTGDVAQLDLFRSLDGGQDWTALNLPAKKPVNPNPEQKTLDVMGGQAFYNQMVLVDPTDKSRNTVYLGGQLSSVKSTDGGDTWTVIANWLALFGLPYVHADYHAAAFFAPPREGHNREGDNQERDENEGGDHDRGAAMLFFGTDGGLFTSVDGGKSWDDDRNEGIVSLLGYTINSNPQRPETSIMGLQDNGTFVRRGGSTVWEQPIGGDGFGAAWSQANDDIVLGTVEFSDIFRSTVDNPLLQSEFTEAIQGIDPGKNGGFTTFFTSLATPRAAADPSGHVFYTYTNAAIYKTTDGAAGAWVNIGQNGGHGGLATLTPSPGIGANRIFRDTVHGIGVSPAPNGGLDTVAVVCNGGWVVVTHDGGTTWHQTPLIGTVTNWQGFNSNAEWADNDTLYIASENPFPSFGPVARVAKSTDGGLTFSESSSGLPDVPINRVLVSPVTSNTLYAATYLGVYRSTDAGANWSRFGAGLPQVEVRDLYVPPDGSFLRIATYGRGVWETQP
jgi:hypothetical protein